MPAARFRTPEVMHPLPLTHKDLDCILPLLYQCPRTMSFSSSKKNLKSIIAASDSSRTYAFGPFQIDSRERRITRDGARIAVTAKAFDTLLFLVERAGHLVEKSEIMEAVWPNSYVEEGNLSVTVHMLRKVLDDDVSEHKYIETVPKRGYRFVGDLREETAGLQTSAQTISVSTTSFAPSSLENSPPKIKLPGFSTSNFTPIRITILTVLALAMVLATVRMRKPSEATLRIRSLAVLPFQNLNSSDASRGQDYLGLGMADAIITKLGTAGPVLVRPTGAVAKYANTLTDPLAAGREQGVDAILSGNIRFQPDRVMVTAQLVRVSNGALMWADTFEETPQRMFALEGEVEERVARSISVQISDDGKSASSTQSEDFKAYQLYLQGRYFWNKRTEEGLRRSIEYFQQATIEDPQYAVAYAGLADSYALLGSYGVEPAQQAYPNARSAALKALQLDDSLPEAYTSLGMISFYYEWNWPQAEHEFKRSIELNPNYPMAHAWYAVDLVALGRNQEALQEVRRAQELDPVSLIINTEVGRVLYLTRHFAQAETEFRKVIDLDPQFARAHSRLGMTYAAEKKFAEAIREFQTAQQLSGQDPYVDGLIGYCYGRMGNSAKAKKILEEMRARAKREFVPAFSMALVFIGLDQRSLAFELLASSFVDRSTYLVYAKADPLLDAVRGDSRFTILIDRMGLS
jgi:DNA-binding winged helix-turn-helix (wHTH) protein/TolB-like protein/lipoprotein NlpI